MNMDQFIKLYYPINTLIENKDLVFKYYVNQYGNKYKDLLNERMENIIYFFNSTPDFTFYFLLQNQKYIINFENMKKMEIEYNDYMSIKKRIKSDIMKCKYILFCISHNISYTEYYCKYDLILELANLFINDISKYQVECSDLGIRPVSDKKIRDRFKIELNLLINNIENESIKESIWWKNLSHSFKSKGINISSIYHFYESINNKNNLGPHCSIIGNNTVVFIPLLECYYKQYCLDRIFLHENRHAIETNIKTNYIGIDSLDNKLEILNEIRTDIHAIDDNNQLPEIFSKEDNREHIIYYYEKIFPYVDDLFFKYGYLFDKLIMEGNIEKLYKIFGKKKIFELENILLEILEIIKSDNFSAIPDKSEALKLVKKMELSSLLKLKKN